MANPVVKMTKPVQDLKSLALVSRQSSGPLPTLANVSVGLAFVGSSLGPVQLTCTEWNLSTSRPQLVLIQPRQNQFTDNQVTNFPTSSRPKSWPQSLIVLSSSLPELILVVKARAGHRI